MTSVRSMLGRTSINSWNSGWNYNWNHSSKFDENRAKLYQSSMINIFQILTLTAPIFFCRKIFWPYHHHRNMCSTVEGINLLHITQDDYVFCLHLFLLPLSFSLSLFFFFSLTLSLSPSLYLQIVGTVVIELDILELSILSSTLVSLQILLGNKRGSKTTDADHAVEGGGGKKVRWDTEIWFAHKNVNNVNNKGFSSSHTCWCGPMMQWSPTCTCDWTPREYGRLWTCEEGVRETVSFCLCRDAFASQKASNKI